MTLEQIKAEISRVKDKLDPLDLIEIGWRECLEWVLFDLIDQLEPSWHPYPAEKPPRYGWYNVTLDDKGRLEVYTSFYSKGGFVWFYDNNIIAWAELPKPYEKDK